MNKTPRRHEREQSCRARWTRFIRDSTFLSRSCPPRSQISDLERHLQSQVDIENPLAVHVSKVETLETVTRLRALPISAQSLEFQSQYNCSVMAWFESELATLRKQFEVEIAETDEEHKQQVKEFDETLKSAQKDTAALEMSMVNQNRIIDKMQQAVQEALIRRLNSSKR
jgi:predicted S18 family serine protease